MQISKGIQIIDTALWLEQENILIINDLHLGYEEALLHKGILVPRFQKKEIIAKLEKILSKIKPKKIILNGDVKHEFGKVLSQEWNEILQFLDFLLQHCHEVVIVKGNHDPIIAPIAIKRSVQVVAEYKVQDILIMHGDQLVETDAKIIIIGHEHPAITLREKSKYEKYKCFLKGKWQGKELIAVPSSNPLLEGTDILKEQLLSPFLTDVKNFQVFIVGKNEVLPFGTVKDLQKLQ